MDSISILYYQYWMDYDYYLAYYYLMDYQLIVQVFFMDILFNFISIHSIIIGWY